MQQIKKPHEPPLSLHPMSLDEAIQKLGRFKPAKKSAKDTPPKVRPSKS
jgi:hypothetical protein